MTFKAVRETVARNAFSEDSRLLGKTISGLEAAQSVRLLCYRAK